MGNEWEAESRTEITAEVLRADRRDSQAKTGKWEAEAFRVGLKSLDRPEPEEPPRRAKRGNSQSDGLTHSSGCA